jgi:hypothetical protein
MSKRKRARKATARSASKIRSKAARRQAAQHHQTRATSKQARVLALLCGPSGATIRHGHALHRLAAAHGARLPGRSGA